MDQTPPLEPDEDRDEVGYVVFEGDGKIRRSGVCRPGMVAAQGRNVLTIGRSEVELLDDRLHRVRDGMIVEDPFPDEEELAAAEAEALLASRGAMQVHRAAVRKALLRLGRLEELDAAIDASSAEARIAWRDVVRFDRLNPDVGLWAPLAGLELDVELDAFFRFAAAIESTGEAPIPHVLRFRHAG